MKKKLPKNFGQMKGELLAPRSTKELNDFFDYCYRHPKQRFWQALTNWSGAKKIYYERFNEDVDDTVAEDVFYWTGKNK